MDENQLRDELKKYNFYHIIQLTENLCTTGYEDYVPLQQVVLRALRSLDVKNKRILDIGCRDGLFSFEAEKLGAKEVIGIDNDLSPGAVNLLIPYFKSNVKMYELNVMELKPESFGTFDIIIFPGVLYHLRYPFWALKLIKDVLREGGQLIVETAVFMDDNSRAMLFCPVGVESPYEDTSCTFFNPKGLIDSLHSLDLFTQKTELFYDKEKSQSHTNLLSILKSRLGFFKPTQPDIDRMTLVCHKQSQAETTLLYEYWHNTHKIHSDNLQE